jgi:hypothetical protein
MDSFLENAQRIFDVARVASGAGPSAEPQDFALLIKPDGGLHFVMESPFSMEGAAASVGAQSAYRVTRSTEGTRVHGLRAGKGGDSEQCLLETRNIRRSLLRDQPLYSITSPLVTSGAPLSRSSSV